MSEQQQQSGEPVKRKRGRPRDPGANRRILDAARAVAGELGDPRSARRAHGAGPLGVRVRASRAWGLVRLSAAPWRIRVPSTMQGEFAPMGKYDRHFRGLRPGGLLLLNKARMSIVVQTEGKGEA